jgi:hypothetical protein
MVSFARALIVSAVVVLLAPAPAAAIQVIFDGPGGYGTTADQAGAAFDAGIVMLDAEEILQPASFGVSIPDGTVLTPGIVGSPSPSNPNTAVSQWTVNSGDLMGDAWLVFLSTTLDPVRGVEYAPQDVGLDLQLGEWGILEIAVGETDYFYPAVNLGLLDVDSSVSFLVHHIVTVALQQSGDELVLPRYGVGVVVDPGVVPEPAAAALLVLGLGGIVARRQRVR